MLYIESDSAYQYKAMKIFENGPRKPYVNLERDAHLSSKFLNTMPLIAWRRNGKPLQYSFLGNPMDKEFGRLHSLCGCKELDTTDTAGHTHTASYLSLRVC